MRLTLKSGKADKVHIFIDGSYEMTVDALFVEKLSLRQNMEINEEELAELRSSVSSRRAFNKACDLLEMRDHSSRELLTKLRQKGFSEGAEEAIERLTELGIVDDERFARAFLSELVKVRHFGKKRIVSELYKKGISREIIDEITDELETDPDELFEIVSKKYARYLSDEKGVRKTINALVRMGYSYSEIRTALERFKIEEE